MKYEFFKPYALHELGQRDNQEDTIFPNKGQATVDDRLFILCDGMGGHQSGEVASQIVCQEICRYITDHAQPGVPFTDADLRQAMLQMYDVLDARDSSGSERKMGTTFVLLYFHAGGVMAAHLGDSRYYHIRPQTNEIIYRSRDHSSLNYRYEAGEISFEEMKTMKGKNVILRAVLPHQRERDIPDIVHIKDVRPDDWFFMCSDGMLESMSDEELLNALCNKDLSDEQKYNWLMTSTEDNQDNHSAYLIHISGVMNELVDASQPDDEQEARKRNKAFLEEMGYQVPDEAVDISISTSNRHVAESKEGAMTVEVVPEDTDTNIVPPFTPSHSVKSGKRNMLWQWLLVALLAIVAFVVIYLLFKPSSSTPKEDKKKGNVRIEYIQDNSNRYSGGNNEGASETVHRGADLNGDQPETVTKTKESASKKKDEKRTGANKDLNVDEKKVKEIVTDKNGAGTPQTGSTPQDIKNKEEQVIKEKIKKMKDKAIEEDRNVEPKGGSIDSDNSDASSGTV